MPDNDEVDDLVVAAGAEVEATGSLTPGPIRDAEGRGFLRNGHGYGSDC